ETLRAASGKDQIPTLVTDDGVVYVGTRRIFEFLETVEPWEHAAAHRERFVEHAPARESDAPGRLVAKFRSDSAGAAVESSPDAAEAVRVPESNRYELRLGDRLIGLAAYEPRGDA